MTRTIWLASYPKSGSTWFRTLVANLSAQDDKPVDIHNLPESGGIASARAGAIPGTSPAVEARRFIAAPARQDQADALPLHQAARRNFRLIRPLFHHLVGIERFVERVSRSPADGSRSNRYRSPARSRP